nr:hypothetical protein [Nostoc sp. ChiSLP03a]MDZ8208234.1 hypothetical protein [Dendronalium sp. ChiSLP03b]
MPQRSNSSIKNFFSASPATKEYLKVDKWLIKAYQYNGQINQAIAL